jgi:ribokinase
VERSQVVVLGSVNVDLILRCPSLPVPGQTVHGTEFSRVPGGKGANQAVAAARMGAQVRFIGAVGADEGGRAARACFIDEGIDARHLRTIDEVATGSAMILVDAATGQNCIALYDGANARVDAALAESALDESAAAAVLVCQLETPVATTLHAARIARDADVPVLLNPAPAVTLDRELLELVDLLVPNESEAMVLAGQPVSAAFDEDLVVEALHAAGARAVLITLGERGILYSDGNTRFRRDAHPVDAIDTSGAGDAFIGALAAALASGRALEPAIELAQQAASLSVTRPGAMASLPYRSELGAEAPTR